MISNLRLYWDMSENGLYIVAYPPMDDYVKRERDAARHNSPRSKAVQRKPFGKCSRHLHILKKKTVWRLCCHSSALRYFSNEEEPWYDPCHTHSGYF